MPCNNCETSFQHTQGVVASIVKSGANALLYLQNQGRNIVHLRRILLCSGGLMLYLRPPPDPISWSYPTAFLEPGITALFYTLNNVPTGSTVQAQAEYVEVVGRSRSCSERF